MEKIDLVLDLIENNEDITQRELARLTSLSLGNINIILKRCLKKGLIMIEKVNSKNIKYILTPAGFAEKANLTYLFVQSAIKSVLTIKENLGIISNSVIAANKKIVFLGKNDDIRTILMHLVSEEKLKDVAWIDDIQKLPINENTLVLLWQPDTIYKCWQNGIEYINILDTSQIERLKR